MTDTETNIEIAEGTQVTLYFALMLENGDIIDSNFESDPATFTVGDGNLLPGFEQALFGLTAGAEEVFTVAPESGFGQSNPNNVQVMPRDQFSADIELEKGLMLSFADAQKAELPGVIADFDEDTVTIDFNHPLAGRTISFRVKIVEVTPAVTH